MLTAARRLRRCVMLTGALAAALATCTAPEDGDADVVAVFSGGVVRARDLDQVLAALPAAERPDASGTGGEAGGTEQKAGELEAIVRRLAVRQLLAAEARSVAGWRHELERQAAITVCLERLQQDAGAPTEADLRSRFDGQREEFRRAERRRVAHLFRRARPGLPADRTLAEVAALRDRLLASESFAELARSASESESRHQGGQLGWIERGQLAPALERVIFSLEPGVASEPIATADGVHLFLVEQVLEAQDFSFEEVRAEIAQRLLAERRAAASADLLEQTPPAASSIPAPEELARLLAEGGASRTVLRLGGYELTLGELRRQLAEAGRSPDPAGAAALLEDAARSEQLAESCRARGLAEPDAVAARIAPIEEQALAERALRSRMWELIEADSSRSEEHYRLHRLRYTTPLRLRLRRLRIPLGASASADMAALEQLGAEARAGTRASNEETRAGTRAPLERAAGELGGEIEDLGWLTLAEIEACCGKAAFFAVDLAAGSQSPPYRTADALEMIELVERQEPEPLPLDQARDRVVADLARIHADELYTRLETELLAAAEFRLLRERLDLIGPAGGSSGSQARRAPGTTPR